MGSAQATTCAPISVGGTQVGVFPPGVDGTAGLAEPVTDVIVWQTPGPPPFPPPSIQAKVAATPESARNASRVKTTTPPVTAVKVVRELSIRCPSHARYLATAAPADVALPLLQTLLSPRRLRLLLWKHPAWDARRNDARCQGCAGPGKRGHAQPAAVPRSHRRQRGWMPPARSRASRPEPASPPGRTAPAPSWR